MKTKYIRKHAADLERTDGAAEPKKKTRYSHVTGAAALLVMLTPVLPAQAQAALCDNLIVNGGFEEPVVTLARKYDFYATIPGWTADPFVAGEILGTSKSIEIQRGGVAGSPYEGVQHVELDSFSPSSMYQDVPTIPGQSYLLQFAYSPRPTVVDNRIEVTWGSSVVAILDRSGVGRLNTDWTLERYTVEATDTVTRLRFTDRSANNALGGYLDAVSLTINSPPVAQCQNVMVVANANCQADAFIDAGSFDLDAGDTIALTQTPDGPYSLGNTLVTLTVTDSCGEVATCEATVTVLSPVSITWLSPLAGQPVASRIQAGQRVPHKIRIADCQGFLPSGITVRLKVEGITGCHTVAEVFDDVIEDATGSGIDGTAANDGIMVLRDGHYHFNLDTGNFTDNNTIANDNCYRSTVTVIDNATATILGSSSVYLETDPTPRGKNSSMGM